MLWCSLYLRDCAGDFERIYVVLLNNFVDDKNNCVDLLQIVC